MYQRHNKLINYHFLLVKICKKLVFEGKVVFTELQKEWVRYRGLYRDYRAADNPKSRKEIMKKITDIKIKN